MTNLNAPQHWIQSEHSPIETAHESGFTLLELMITVLIIGILAAIAVPSYNNYITRSRVADAVGQLSAMRVRMEQHFQDNRSYLTACVPASIAPLPNNTSTFSYSCQDGLGNAGPGTNSYAVLANGSGAMTGFLFSINSTNERQTLSLPADWQLTPAVSTAAPANCWVKTPHSC